MRGIFDYRKPMLVGKGPNRIQIAWFTGNVNRNDRPRARRNPSLDVPGINIESALYAVAKHGSGAEIGHHFRRCREGVGGKQYLVLGPQADGVESQLQRGGAGIYGESMLGADVFGKSTFELMRHR